MSSLTHEGFSFRGIHSSPNPGALEVQKIDEAYFGQNGSRQIWGGVVGQEYRFVWWIDDSFANAAAVRAHINEAYDQLGLSGTLTFVDANETLTLLHTVFENLQWIEGPFQPTGTASGWWAKYELLFRCLRP